MNTDKAFGLLAGLALVAVIAVVVWLLRKEPDRGKFDERQLTLRATGYRRSFFVTLAALFLVLFLTELEILPAASVTLAMFAAMMIGIVTFAVYCITKDVFFHVGEKGNYYRILCAVIVVLDGVPAATRIADGSLLENGVPTFEGCNGLVMALSFLVILIALLTRKSGGEDDE